METAQAADKLTVAEVCAMTGLGRATAIREIGNGEFEAFRVGPAKKHIRVTRASVEAYLARRAIPSPTPSPAAA